MPGPPAVPFACPHHIRAIAVFLMLIVTLVPVAAASGDESGPGDWDRLASHALNTTVWTGDGRASSWQQLARDAADRRHVLIGENHDNADHHRIQARLIDALVAANRKPSVVFEMIPGSEQAVLDAYLARPDSDAEGLGEAIGWERRGWPAWQTYQPIAEAAMAGKLPLLAGGIERSRVMQLARARTDELDPAERQRLGLDRDLPDALLDDLLEELKVSHCDLMPKEALTPMVTVQRARDGAMARTMLDAGSGGAVLIAGKGHVRQDRGVPFVLSRLGVAAPDILSVGLVGVEPGLQSVSDYLGGEDRFPFDYVVFTERAEPVDHCAELREHFSEKTHGGSGR